MQLVKVDILRVKDAARTHVKYAMQVNPIATDDALLCGRRFKHYAYSIGKDIFKKQMSQKVTK